MADPNLLMKVCTRETKYGIEKYYSYILRYIDDILCVHDDPDSISTQLDKYFPHKPDSVGEPEIYLGAKLMPMQLENGVGHGASAHQSMCRKHYVIVRLM